MFDCFDEQGRGDACDPYPFDENDLVVPVVITEIKDFNQKDISLIELYKIPKKIVSFTFQKSK